MAEEVILPSLGQTTNELKIASWVKLEGDPVAKGDVLLEVETDKAIVEVEAYASGILKGISFVEGDTVMVGTILAWIANESEAADFVPPNQAAQAMAAQAELMPVPQAPTAAIPGAQIPVAAAAAVAAVAGTARRTLITPLARRLAEPHGLDIASIPATGAGGVIKKRDVEAHLAQRGSATTGFSEPACCVPAAAGTQQQAEEKRTVLSKMRKTIGDRLLESKSKIPHFYVVSHIDATKLVELRKQLKPLRGRDVSYNSMIVRAICVALRKYPALNASLDGNEIVEHGGIHMGLAVEVPDGLRVPVIRHADHLDLWALTDALKDVAERAKENRLSTVDISGGTFTVSSLGMFGVDEFQAIVNPPEAGIIAIGKIAEKAFVKNGEVVAGMGVTLSLSADHRIVDGAIAGRFMQAVREELEEPLKLLAPIV